MWRFVIGCLVIDISKYRGVFIIFNQLPGNWGVRILRNVGNHTPQNTVSYPVCCLFSWRYSHFGCIFHNLVAGFSLLIRGFLITYNDAPQSVGLLWTSDQSVAETSTWQHTTLTTDKHPWSRWDSNPQSQQASGRRPTPYTTRPLGPAQYHTLSFLNPQQHRCENL